MFYLCLCCATPQVQGGSWCLVVGERDPISTSRNERSTVVWERPDGVPNMCVRSAWPGQQIRFESSASHGLGLLDPFATQSNKSNIILINLDVCLKFYHGWIGLVAYIEWLIN